MAAMYGSAKDPRREMHTRVLQWRPRPAGSRVQWEERVFQPVSSNVIAFRPRRRSVGARQFALEVLAVCCAAILVNALIVLIYSGAL